MTTRYIDNPPVQGSCLHNSRRWQVTVMGAGLGAELLLKRRDVSRKDAQALKLSLHDCYPSIFFQGEESEAFLEALRDAQNKLKAAEIDRLILDQYLVCDVFH